MRKVSITPTPFLGELSNLCPWSFIQNNGLVNVCKLTWRKDTLAELHADLLSRHASPLEVHVFVAVGERGEDVTSDEICRRCVRLCNVFEIHCDFTRSFESCRRRQVWGYAGYDTGIPP